MSDTKNQRINFLKQQVSFITDLDKAGFQFRKPGKANHSHRLKVSVSVMVPFIVDWQLPARGNSAID